jgi:anti-sigma B factor antagonist
VIIRLLDRDSDVAPAPDGGSDTAVITDTVSPGGRPPEAPRAPGGCPPPRTPLGAEPAQLELSCRTGANGYQIVSVTGELDIATAEQAYSYISEIIDGRLAPVTVDLSGLTFCDASGLGVLARAARYARQKGRQLTLASARPSLQKIMRITGLDRAFPELRPSAHAYSALPTRARTGRGAPNRVFWPWRILPVGVKFGVLPALNLK